MELHDLQVGQVVEINLDLAAQHGGYDSTEAMMPYFPSDLAQAWLEDVNRFVVADFEEVHDTPAAPYAHVSLLPIVAEDSDLTMDDFLLEKATDERFERIWTDSNDLNILDVTISEDEKVLNDED